MNLSTSKNFALGNESLFSNNPVFAIKVYLEGALELNSLYAQFESNLDRARRVYLRKSQETAPRLAVCGWSLSHNPAGRVMTLKDAYQPSLESGELGALEIIGSLFPRWGETVWGPMGELDIPCHVLRLEDDAEFLTQALHFVAQHPYDIVHLSKPRFPNLVFGLLYQLVWGAHVIWDIDDEELAFAEGAEPLALSAALELRPTLAVNEPLHKPFWTQLSMGEVGRFPVASVSNPALQQRYGGELLPHVRNGQHFIPSAEKRRAARAHFGIPTSARVVLFMGTPREHKGLVETAQGLASLAREDVWFVIAGSFPGTKSSQRLKVALEAVQGVQMRWLGDQPFSTLPDVVAMGDYCVLLQEVDSMVSQFQLPAKLVDALAMGLIVLARVTPATQWLADAGVVTPVTLENFPAAMQQQLEVKDEGPQRRFNRQYFEKYLSIAAVQPTVQRWLAASYQRPTPLHWQGRLQGLLEGKLGSLLS